MDEYLMEEWKPVAGCFGYEVSNLGSVRSVDKTIRQTAKGGSTATHRYKGRLLKPVVHKNGYLFVNVGGKLVSVHRLVAITFIANADEKPQVNHKDGDKSNNRVDNLEWVTAQENSIHAVKNGFVNYDTPKRKEMQLKNIRRAIESNIGRKRG